MLVSRSVHQVGPADPTIGWIVKKFCMDIFPQISPIQMTWVILRHADIHGSHVMCHVGYPLTFLLSPP